MSYEILRADLISRLQSSSLSDTQLEEVLQALDHAADRFDVRPKCTDLIVREDYLEPVRLYIATKSVEGLTRETLKNYYLALTKFINTLQRPITEITAVNVRVYLDNYQKLRHICNSTKDGLRVTIKDFFTWCLEEGLIPSNPCAHVKAIRFSDNSRQPMTPLELEKVRRSSYSPREVALVEVLNSTAARISEVCNIKISDIDFAEKTIVIPHGKGDKRRTVYLNAKSILSIHAYLGTRTDDCEYLFVNVRGKSKHKLCRKTLEMEIKKVVSRADVKTHITPHVFRTSTSTRALDSGMPIEQVQRMLGHAKIQTTLRYAKINDAEVKRSHQRYVS